LSAGLFTSFDTGVTVQSVVVLQVNLQTGIPRDSVNETCTAGAGTLLLEFGLLSRLLDDPVYEGFARRAINQLWSHRSNVTGLFGTYRLSLDHYCSIYLFISYLIGLGNGVYRIFVDNSTTTSDFHVMVNF